MSSVIGRYVYKSDKLYIKINRNQMQILDALYIDGSFVKKYIDKHNKLRFSEHYGYFNNNNNDIDRIIVSGKTDRHDKGDPTILLPNNLHDTYNYDIVYHTHPATPLPGSRIKESIILEMPSINDIFHFIDHYNNGKTLGSIIITPEGVYVIKCNKNVKKVKYNDEIEDNLYERMDDEVSDLHSEITNYITENKLTDKLKKNFNKTVQPLLKKYTKKYENIINKYLNNQLSITIKPRFYEKRINKWILKDLYLFIK
jgi:hypothetical protein